MLLGTSALAVSPLAVPATSWAAAPQSGSVGAPYARYKMGEFEITAFNDGTRAADSPEKIYGVNQKPEDVAAAAEANFLPKDKLLNGFTPVLVNTGKELVLFDSGNGVKGQPATGHLAERMKAAGVDPEQIDVVVITHCHPDHIGGLMSEGTPLAPKARYVIGEAEYQFWSSPDRANGPTANAAKVVQSNVVPLKDKMTFVKNDGEVVSGIRAVEAFGHTPGHMAWHVESGGKRILIGGRFLQPLCAVAALPQMACQLRCRQGTGRRDAPQAPRHAERRACSLHQLSYAVPSSRLCREGQRWRLPLRAGELSADALGQQRKDRPAPLTWWPRREIWEIPGSDDLRPRAKACGRSPFKAEFSFFTGENCRTLFLAR